jgi:GxxExxY protein
MHENDTAREVVDAAYQVHTALGPGLIESIYHRALEHELTLRQIEWQSEVPVRATYKGVELGHPFRLDLVVNGHVIIELKSLEIVAPIHKKQLLTYLRVTGMRLGLLINFGAPTIKSGITRVVNGLV